MPVTLIVTRGKEPDKDRTFKSEGTTQKQEALEGCIWPPYVLTNMDSHVPLQ